MGTFGPHNVIYTWSTHTHSQVPACNPAVLIRSHSRGNGVIVPHCSIYCIKIWYRIVRLSHVFLTSGTGCIPAERRSQGPERGPSKGPCICGNITHYYKAAWPVGYEKQCSLSLRVQFKWIKLHCCEIALSIESGTTIRQILVFTSRWLTAYNILCIVPKAKLITLQ